MKNSILLSSALLIISGVSYATLSMEASSQTIDEFKESGAVIEVGVNPASSFADKNIGPMGMKAKDFVATGAEEYINLGYQFYIPNENLGLEVGTGYRTLGGKSHEGQLYGKMLFYPKNYDGVLFFGGSFGIGKDMSSGRNWTMITDNPGGGSTSVAFSTADNPSFKTASGFVGTTYPIYKNLGLTIIGEVQEKNYDLGVGIGDTSATTPAFALDAQAAKIATMDMLNYKVNIGIQYKF